MTVPTIALYVSSGSVCSAPHQINSSASFDIDSRPTLSAAATPQKAMPGGLSCLFPTAQVKSSYSNGAEDLGSLWQDRAELASSFRHSSISSSLKRDHAHLSPVSVFQGPSSSISLSSWSPPTRIGADFSSLRSGSRGMFNGFVRHAFSPCVDYNSSLNVEDLNSCNDDLSPNELTFIMEDNFEVSDMPPYAKELLFDARSRHSIFRDEFVVKAFNEAEKAHRGQKRASGHPYLLHCLETAILLADIGANSTIVAAGILHDTVDDSDVTFNHISEIFGDEVADLVQGVSKLSNLSKLARESNTANKTDEADRLHTMFLAMVDARSVLIKLADRLHNMMTLDALPLIKQKRFAEETSEIFVPLVNRLGIRTWKEQLENLCFKHLQPDQHQELSSELANYFDEDLITSSVEKLKQALDAGAISSYCLSGRHKSLYSIHSKMLKKNLNMDEIHDIHGLRLIVETEEDCYKALKVVQQLWHEAPGRFKDYIVDPKCNGYQSLHTVVVPDGIPLEIQIRSKKMHVQAEYGFAAHWRYKEGDCKHPAFILQMVQWARQVISWHCEAMSRDSLSICTSPIHSKDCTFSCKPQCDGPIFVIIIEHDKMSVQEFPANSSVMDLLESFRWTPPMKEEQRPRLNHEPISDTTCKLKMGDFMELTPGIADKLMQLPDKSLTVCREKMQRIYDSATSSPCFS